MKAFRAARGWSAVLPPAHNGPQTLFQAGLVWTDGTCSVFKARDSARYLYRYENMAEALIDLLGFQVELTPLTPDYAESTLDHFWADMILPGLLDYQGYLVLHAGAVIVNGVAAVFIGDSGRGKSTLTASFFADGHTVLSDDGIIISCKAGTLRAEAVYPGIRLLPETLSALFAGSVPTTEVAHYARKRRIVPNAKMSAASFPLGAMFFLEEPASSGSVSISPMGAADACIGIVSKSFALDPSDKLRARSRIKQASRLATAVPSFTLDYPREVSALPQVRQAIAETIAHARQAQLRLLAQK